MPDFDRRRRARRLLSYHMSTLRTAMVDVGEL